MEIHPTQPNFELVKICGISYFLRRIRSSNWIHRSEIYIYELKGPTKKGLRWIPRHPETMKGVVSDEMLRGVENKRDPEIPEYVNLSNCH